MAGILRKFIREANAMGATDQEALAALLDMGATVYAVRLAGADDKHEKRRAKAAFLRVAMQALDNLPTSQMDQHVEGKLREKGL